MISWWETRRLLSAAVAAWLVFSSSLLLGAEDRNQTFLNGLRQRGYYDTALDFLESMRTNASADKAFKSVIDYEVGVTLVASARLVPLVDRELRLNEARSSFQKFIDEHSNDPLALSAGVSLANLMVERGRVKMAQADRSGRTVDQKTQLQTEARGLYQDARRLFNVIEGQLSAKHKEYKSVDSDDTKRLAERTQIRLDIMQTRMALASIVYEIAQTYEKGSEDHKGNLTEAAEKFAEFYKKYSRWIGGFYARIEEARCYQELGDYAKAMSVLNEVIEKQEDEEGFHRVRNAAMVLAMQTAVLPQVKKYEEAVAMYRNWESNIARRNEAAEEALAIRCIAGEAALELARSLKIDSPQAAKLRKDLILLAKDMFVFVTRHPGEYRRTARVRMSDPLFGGEVQVMQAKTYDEARDRGKIAWDRLQEPDLTPQEIAQLRTEALRNFHRAMVKARAGATVDDLNAIRYCLAYLYWSSEAYYEARVMGEFLARRYPNRPEAQQGAKIALAACAKLVGAAQEDRERKFENRRMTDIAEYITHRWPNSPAADEAWMMLIRSAVSQRDLDKMMEYLAQVSKDSPRRGDTEVLTGQTLWAAYLEASRLPEDKRPSKAELKKMLSQAMNILRDGINRLRTSADAGADPTFFLETAVLSLAQANLEAGLPAKAAEWLDDPMIGPNIMVRSNRAIARQTKFRVETLKASLRAYVGAKLFQHVEETMNVLEKVAEDANLTSTYVNLGLQLQDSFKKAVAKGKRGDAAKTAAGFTLFLDRICARPRKEADFRVLNWAAEMYSALAENADSGDGKATAEAAAYYQKAADAYAAVVEECKKNDMFAPTQDAVYSVKLRMARCLRRVGKFSPAMDAITEVLDAKSSFIEAQREAAYTYQAWGEESPEKYLSAIMGGDKVWGWGGIAKRIQNNENFGHFFHEARYNLALCRFKYAMSKVDRERAALLEQARRDIVVIYKLYPNMGGEKWRAKYDALLKEIEHRLGVAAVGLRGLEIDSLEKAKKSGN